MIIKEKEFKPYFDINNDSEGVISRAYQEERGGGVDLRVRIVHAEEYLKSRIEADDWNYNKHSEREREATINVFELMSDGYGMVIWLSPKSDVYEEGRLNIMLKTKIEGREGFDPWGIPLLLNEQDTFELGERLQEGGGVTMNGIKDIESLRKEPIGFRIEESEDWMEKCEILMPEYREWWQFIKEGFVEENMEKIMGKVKEAKKVCRGSNVVFELEMLKQGYRLNVSGSHGGSWLSQGGRGIGLFEVFDKQNMMGRGDERLSFCQLCGNYYIKKKGSCPRCNHKVSDN